jgi:hypothetical protein
MYNVMYRRRRVIRKQIYIEKHQQEAIRRRADAQGISEAEVVRLAIDGVTGSSLQAIPSDGAAWDRALRLMRSLQRNRRGKKASARQWNRDELYQERLNRYGRRSG